MQVTYTQTLDSQTADSNAAKARVAGDYTPPYAKATSKVGLLDLPLLQTALTSASQGTCYSASTGQRETCLILSQQGGLFFGLVQALGKDDTVADGTRANLINGTKEFIANCNVDSIATPRSCASLSGATMTWATIRTSPSCKLRGAHIGDIRAALFVVMATPGVANLLTYAQIGQLVQTWRTQPSRCPNMSPADLIVHKAREIASEQTSDPEPMSAIVYLNK